MASEYAIVLADEAWDRFWSYVSLMSGEVAAFGYCKPDDELRAVYVDELFLVPQEADSSQVDFITEGLPYAVRKAMADDRANDLRFCIHSHGHHGASWSNTDEDMIEKIALTGTPWFASVIFNKKGDTCGRLDLFRSALSLPGLDQATVECEVWSERSLGLMDECAEELKQFVKKPKPKQITQTSTNRKAGDKTTPKDDSDRHNPVLNVQDLIEYDDDVMLDINTGMYYQLDNQGRIFKMTDQEVEEWLKKVPVSVKEEVKGDEELFGWDAQAWGAMPA